MGRKGRPVVVLKEIIICQYPPLSYKIENMDASPKLSMQSSIIGNRYVSTSVVRFNLLYSTQKRSLQLYLGANTTGDTHVLLPGLIIPAGAGSERACE